MSYAALSQLTTVEIDRLDPYAFMAVLGKRVIHPGGNRSTQELFQLVQLKAHQHVLEVGCGVGTTAINLARRFGVQVTAVDIDPLMLDRAQANVQLAGLEKQVVVTRGDIQDLDFADGTFDCVIIEAVTMFVDRLQAANEVTRVCRIGGFILDHEFIYRRPPTPQVRRIFEGEVCPGIRFDTVEDWVQLYQATGLSNIQFTTGPFVMMTPAGFLRDEGLTHCLTIMRRVFSSRVYLKKMGWLMSRMVRVMPYLGYVVVAGTKPA